MKTIAPDAPTSHTSARCSAETPGAAVIDGREPSAVATYAITHSPTYGTQPVAQRPNRLSCRLSCQPSWGRCLISVVVLRHQRRRRLEKNVRVEQHRPVPDGVEVELEPL